MNLINKYLETIFDSRFFAEELYLLNHNTSINCIRDEEQNASYVGFNIVGTTNKIMIKTTDKQKYNLEQDNTIKLNNVVYFIKEIIDNNNGTTTLSIEKQ